MPDLLLRGMNAERSVRVVATVATETVTEVTRRLETVPVEAIAVGRAAAAGLLLATVAKGSQERVLLDVGGGGSLGHIYVDAWGNGRVRVALQRRLSADHPSAQLLEVDGRPTLAAALGARGQVVVTRDLGMRQRYQGSVDMVAGEIDLDIESYLDKSEQLPSALSCATVLDTDGGVLRSAGILCQTFPNSPPEVIAEIRERFKNGALRALLRSEREPAQLAAFALGGEPPDNVSESEVGFHCPCGPQTARSVLSTLGPSDLDALATEQPQTEVRCHFCGARYELAADQIRELANELRLEQS